MRVLLLTWEYPPLIEGGLARHVCKLSERLVRQGVEVHVLTRGDDGLEAFSAPSGVFVHRVREPARPDGLEEFVTWVEHMNSDLLAAGVALGDKHTFDIVHVHDWLVAVAGDHLARRFNCPLVATIHATEFGRHQGWVDKHPQSHIHSIEHWLTNRADHVITCSNYMCAQVEAVFSLKLDTVTVIPNGVDPYDLRPDCDLAAVRARYAAAAEQLVLLPGRLVYEKGFQDVLAALPQVIEAVPGLRFVVAGSGTHERELQVQAEALGLLRYGSFLGWVSDDLLHALYSVADLCVIPSIYEPFGLVVLEAMASGCPCLVADTGGLKEVVPNNQVALLFDQREPGEIAELIKRMLCDAELRSGIIHAAAAHVKQFDWSVIAARTLTLYERLVEEFAPLTSN